MTKKGAIYFDGLCLLCSKEINHYRNLVGAENFEFIDITKIDFDAKAHGLDPYKVHKVMHVRDTNGNMQEGVDAFRAIWNELPRYKVLAQLSKANSVQFVLKLGYNVFVKIRPYLPRKKADCATSPYCEIRP